VSRLGFGGFDGVV